MVQKSHIVGEKSNRATFHMIYKWALLITQSLKLAQKVEGQSHTRPM